MRICLIQGETKKKRHEYTIFIEKEMHRCHDGNVDESRGEGGKNDGPPPVCSSLHMPFFVILPGTQFLCSLTLDELINVGAQRRTHTHSKSPKEVDAKGVQKREHYREIVNKNKRTRRMYKYSIYYYTTHSRLRVRVSPVCCLPVCQPMCAFEWLCIAKSVLCANAWACVCVRVSFALQPMPNSYTLASAIQSNIRFAKLMYNRCRILSSKICALFRHILVAPSPYPVSVALPLRHVHPKIKWPTKTERNKWLFGHNRFEKHRVKTERPINVCGKLSVVVIIVLSKSNSISALFTKPLPSNLMDVFQFRNARRSIIFMVQN